VSVDVILFWGRILFLIGLYVFLAYVVLALTRDLRGSSASPEEAAPGELVVVEPAGSGLRANDAFPLAAETFLGRAPENTVVLSDSTVSGRHGRLVYRGGAWEIEDLGSTNGTFINDRRVKKAKVDYGDVVALGGVSVKLVKA